MRKNKILYALLLLSLLALNLYLNNVYALLLLLTAVAIPLLSILFCYLSKDGVSMDLRATDPSGPSSSAAFVGTLRNTSLFPAPAIRGRLSVQNGLTGTTIEKGLRASIAGKAKKTLQFQVADPEVGNLYATVLHLTSQDIFGLVSFPVNHVAAAEQLVPPPDIPSEVFMVEALETTGESARYSEKEKGTDVSELFDIREYAPGDEIRAIHWKLSAKQDTPVLREFSKPLNYSVILLVELAEASANALQACVAYASSISKGLLEAGVLHTIAWYDSAADEFCDLNITNLEEQALAELRLTSSAYHESESASLNRFLETDGVDPTSTLIYLTTRLSSDLILKAARSMPTRVELVGTEKDTIELDGLLIDRLPPNMKKAGTLSLTV
ncbi:MAG: DUF58 domain-containing protein [Clostridia bacterium]|nr:DUF58 domain-containing protein [Clostridia bacterium]MBR1704615.1 DUF58 domain-containing protein [Clostridia bacterium]